MEILHWFEPHANGCNLRFDRELARQQKKALKIRNLTSKKIQ